MIIFCATYFVVKFFYIYKMKLKKQYICHTGGAEGTDGYFEYFSKQYGVKTIAYSYKTRFHESVNKRELTEAEFKEGVQQVYIANATLKRARINQYLKLLARNWFQVKYADEVFAITSLKKYNGLYEIKGGTAWAVQMAINEQKKIFVFDQSALHWFYFDYYVQNFCLLKIDPKITSVNFTGIGTRSINFFGISAIEQLFKNSFT